MAMDKPSSFNHYFRNLDQLGKPLTFRYNKRKVLKSKTGATISIMIGVLALLYAIYSLSILIQRS